MEPAVGTTDLAYRIKAGIFNRTLANRYEYQTNRNDTFMKELWKTLTAPFSRHAEWWNDYLTEISVIIVSLGITYYGDSLMQDYQDGQEDLEAMKMIRRELVSDLDELRQIQAYSLKEIRFSESLGQALLEKKLPAEDSVKTYYNQHRLYYYWFLKTNAFEMLRESSSMQRLDKQLLTQLFGCYEQLEVMKDIEKRYREEKFTRIVQFTDALEGEPHAETTLRQWQQIERDGKFRRFLLTLLPMLAKSSLSVNLSTQQYIEDMLQTLDKAYPSARDDEEAGDKDDTGTSGDKEEADHPGKLGESARGATGRRTEE